MFLCVLAYVVTLICGIWDTWVCSSFWLFEMVWKSLHSTGCPHVYMALSLSVSWLILTIAQLDKLLATIFLGIQCLTGVLCLLLPVTGTPHIVCGREAVWLCGGG